MIIDTKKLFLSIIKDYPVNCICDIGSRDGRESLIFKHIQPKSKILAFEANYINFKKMQMDKQLIGKNIVLYPYAISNLDGQAYINILDFEDNQSISLKGMSSLKDNLDYPDAVKKLVETKRLDSFINNTHPDVKSICLWIDVEGHEYEVVEGIINIKEKVLLIHVETATRSLRVGQHVLSELDLLLEDFGFKKIGSNFKFPKEFGDVLYVNNSLLSKIKYKLHYFILIAFFSRLIGRHVPKKIKRLKMYAFLKRIFS